MTFILPPIIAFLPCRSGSERVKQKNTRQFAGIEGGLTSIKMQQLLNCEEIDVIVISTNDEKVANICHNLSKNQDKVVKIIERPHHLATSTTSTDDLIKYIPEIISEGEILWTHVTSPFVDSRVYTEAIQTYRQVKKLETHDSLMSVTSIQKFIWDKNSSINYNREIEKWPRTQTLPKLYEVNSAIFITSHEVYTTINDRIGKRVYLFELTSNQAMDIDWENDFKLAEKYWLYGE